MSTKKDTTSKKDRPAPHQEANSEQENTKLAAVPENPKSADEKPNGQPPQWRNTVSLVWVVLAAVAAFLGGAWLSFQWVDDQLDKTAVSMWAPCA